MSDSCYIEEAKNNIIIENRGKVSISGVSEVINFDEKEISMETCQGQLTIVGEGIHVEKLNLEIGEITLTGRIDGVEYTGRRDTKSFWSRIF